MCGDHFANGAGRHRIVRVLENTVGPDGARSTVSDYVFVSSAVGWRFLESRFVAAIDQALKRRGRDSNSRSLAGQRFSRPPQSATLPPLQAQQYRAPSAKPPPPPCFPV